MTCDDQTAAVEATVGGIVDDRAVGTAARSSVDQADGYDRELWKELGAGFGICAMHAPEEYGGAGEVSLTAAAVRALGARLSSLPYLPTVGLGSMPLLTLERSDAGEEVLGALLSGERTATAVLDADLVVEAGTVSGRAARVLHGASADWLLVPQGDRLLGIRREDVTAADAFDSIDLARPLADLTLRSAPAVELGGGDSPAAVLRHTLMTLLAHESAAGSQRVTQLAVDYARVREQFGRPIGSYQSIKHLCAEAVIDAEASAAAAWAASDAIGTSGHPVAAMAAFVYSTEAYVRTATQSLHVHGGVGFTWEFDAHLYYRRAHANTVLLGRPSTTKRAYARELVAGLRS